MAEAMDREDFGTCCNHYECAKACPRSMPLSFIARLKREFMRAGLPGQVHGEPVPHAAHEE
ncbi:MAG: hypothetical protein LJE83_04220 [Gammaproteobacteria bacterium]|jgi:succinate dehydrogenase / fumarate reductase iron-sulfur subunit|nr:hypothetical protein [Gammaproteobacteria bacterium]